MINKNITKFFEGLGKVNAEIKQCADLAFLDLLPQYTTRLDQWFDQFGIADTGTLTDQEKRSKYAAAWSATGSLSPRYLQDTLQNNGFNVYVHEFWEPGTEPPVGVQGCATVRNPFNYLTTGGFVSAGTDCGEAAMECGEAFAECGNSSNVLGYPLVNKIQQSQPAFTTLCGDVGAECGEAGMGCGNYTSIEDISPEPTIPADPNKWPYFVYIGSQTFPNLAVVPGGRRDEFENLLLKYVRASNWIGVMVTYS